MSAADRDPAGPGSGNEPAERGGRAALRAGDGLGWRRPAALGIDFGLHVATLVGACVLTYWALGWKPGPKAGLEHAFWMFTLWIPGYTLAIGTVATGVCLARFGASPGGWVLGLRVVGRSGGLGTVRAFVRAFARTLETALGAFAGFFIVWRFDLSSAAWLLLLPAGAFVPLLPLVRNPGARTLAEWITGTRTQRRERPTVREGG